MDPAERLRQLREQRQLVARHLAWLEGQIAAEEAAAPAPAASPSHPAADGVADPAPPAAAQAPAPAADHPEPSTQLPTAVEAGFDRRQRIGCIVAGIIGAAGLLFLLWGLPQLLY